MTNQHPITPPQELLDKWNNLSLSTQEIFVIVAQWGADQELEACCEWLGDIAYRQSLHLNGSHLRAARRPKPPSLKEQLVQKLEHIRDVADKYRSTQNAIDDLREALEALPND